MVHRYQLLIRVNHFIFDNIMAPKRIAKSFHPKPCTREPVETSGTRFFTPISVDNEIVI